MAASISASTSDETNIAASPIIFTRRTADHATSPANSPNRPTRAPRSSGGSSSPSFVNPTMSAKQAVTSSAAGGGPRELGRRTHRFSAVRAGAGRASTRARGPSAGRGLLRRVQTAPRHSQASVPPGRASPRPPGRGSPPPPGTREADARETSSIPRPEVPVSSIDGRGFLVYILSGEPSSSGRDPESSEARRRAAAAPRPSLPSRQLRRRVAPPTRLEQPLHGASTRRSSPTAR